MKRLVVCLTETVSFIGNQITMAMPWRYIYGKFIFIYMKNEPCNDKSFKNGLSIKGLLELKNSRTESHHSTNMLSAVKVVIKPSNWSFSDGIMFFFTLKKQQVRCSIRQTSFLGRFMSDFFWVNQPLAEIQKAEDDEKFYFMVALILQSCN